MKMRGAKSKSTGQTPQDSMTARLCRNLLDTLSVLEKLCKQR